MRFIIYIDKKDRFFPLNGQYYKNLINQWAVHFVATMLGSRQSASIKIFCYQFFLIQRLFQYQRPVPISEGAYIYILVIRKQCTILNNV